MDFKQKAEEKKMSMSKNIARLAVTAGLTAALSFGGVMAPVTMAFAEDTTGSITINHVADNDSTTFRAYQIFKATVTDTKSGGKTAQDITWANDTVGPKVISAIKTGWKAYDRLSDSEKLSPKPTPQEVADFITAHAGACTAGSESIKGTRIATNNILYAVADAIKDETPAKSDIAANTAWAPGAENGSGYYLFVTNALNDSSEKVTGTAPIFAVVGGNAVTVTEKTSIPTVDKQILAAAPADPTQQTTGWAGVANSQIGQEVTYKLTGKVADNYDTYDSYAYKFTDTLSNGLDYVQNSLSVYAVNSSGQYTPIDDTAYQLTTSNDNHVLTVNFVVDKDKNKKGLKDVQGVDADTQIVVFYRAKLNAKAVIAGANGELGGNSNTVTLEYSNNPMSGGTGTSASDTVKDYTYGLRINKVDLGTERALKDAKFTITTNGDENSTEVKYVTKDGTLSGSKVELSTDDDGVIKLTGLDAGVYTVTETSAPEGYTTVQSFTFEIKPTMNAEDPGAGLTELTGVLDSKNQGDKVIAGLTNGKSGDNKLTAKDDSLKNADGTFNITVGDTKQVGLPLTGLNGVTFTWIAGGAVLCIGVAHLIRSRKQAEESEQE